MDCWNHSFNHAIHLWALCLKHFILQSLRCFEVYRIFKFTSAEEGERRREGSGYLGDLFFVFPLIFLIIIFNTNIIIVIKEEEDILCNELTTLRLINNIMAHSSTNRILNIHYYTFCIESEKSSSVYTVRT